jgi:hypothetical protein
MVSPFARIALAIWVMVCFVAFVLMGSALVTLPTLPAPPTLRKLAYNCPSKCSLREEVIGAKNAGILKAMRENGAGRPTIQRRAIELLGRHVADSVVTRHLQHYVEIKTDEPEEEGPRPSDLAILDGIILSGFRNSRNWKPTIRDTLDAMKLKVSMTGQSAFEDMLKAMDAAFDLPDDENENPDAILAPEERSEKTEELLDPPLDGE